MNVKVKTGVVRLGSEIRYFIFQPLEGRYFASYNLTKNPEFTIHVLEYF